MRERERIDERERQKAYQSFWERLRGVDLSMGGERESNGVLFTQIKKSKRET